jgi:hypothetical protein
VHQQRRLLLDRLYGYEAHRRTLDRFADRLRISGVVFVALDVGLHVLRRHETHLMAQLDQLAGPVMRRRASFHANQTWPQVGKKPNNLIAPQSFSYDCRTGRIHAMDLENVLGQVQTNCCNLAHGWLPLLVIFDDHHFGT